MQLVAFRVARGQASPTISTTLSASSIGLGGTANDTSVLSGAGASTGTGTATYSYYTNNTCTTGKVSAGSVTVGTTGSVPNSSTVTFTSAGTYYWQAVYSGDANNNGASSPCTAANNEQLTVNKASPSISTTLSASSSSAASTANDTSVLSGAGASTGTATVTYSYYTNNTCTTGKVSAGTVTVPVSGSVPNSSTVTFTSAGTYYWQAVYSGDANNNGASSPCTAANNEQLTVSVSTSVAPVAAYGFNEGTGTTTADASGNALTGTLDDATWAAGKYGSAVNLDGVDDYVDLGNQTPLQVTGSMTISGWVNSAAFPADDATTRSKKTE